jgi:hypothetical protein
MNTQKWKVKSEQREKMCNTVSRINLHRMSVQSKGTRSRTQMKQNSSCQNRSNVCGQHSACGMQAKAFALMMEAVRTSETSVNSYQSTWRYNPEDGHLECKPLANGRDEFVVTVCERRSDREKLLTLVVHTNTQVHKIRRSVNVHAHGAR